jgi:hypothetical protein
MADTPSTSGTVLSWNLTNWVTVVLMALVAFGGIALAQSWYQKRAS